MQGPVPTFAELAKRKAFELAYATFRITRVLASKDLAGRLESAALSVLESSISENYSLARPELEKMEYFIRLGSDAGFIYPDHAELVFSEIASFYEAIIDHEEGDAPPPVNLEGIFSKIEFKREEVQRDYEAMKYVEKPKVNDIPPKEEVRPKEEKSEGRGADDASKRKKVILDLLGRMSPVKMKDIQFALPNVSERTLRYDIQSLVNRREIVREGESGPGVSYRLFEVANPSGEQVDGSAKIQKAFAGYFE